MWKGHVTRVVACLFCGRRLVRIKGERQWAGLLEVVVVWFSGLRLSELFLRAMTIERSSGVCGGSLAVSIQKNFRSRIPFPAKNMKMWAFLLSRNQLVSVVSFRWFLLVSVGLCWYGWGVSEEIPEIVLGCCRVAGVAPLRGAPPPQTRGRHYDTPPSVQCSVFTN